MKTILILEVAHPAPAGTNEVRDGRNHDKAQALVESLHEALQGVDFLLVAARTTGHRDGRPRSMPVWTISTCSIPTASWKRCAPMNRRCFERDCTLSPKPASLRVGYISGRQVRVEASLEQEDGYELTAIPVVAILKQYDRIRRPGLHMMGHLAEPDCLFQDIEQMGVRVTTTLE